eukprot:2441900-Amphidinium_carterae.1
MTNFPPWVDSTHFSNRAQLLNLPSANNQIESLTALTCFILQDGFKRFIVYSSSGLMYRFLKYSPGQKYYNPNCAFSEL